MMEVGGELDGGEKVVTCRSDAMHYNYTCAKKTPNYSPCCIFGVPKTFGSILRPTDSSTIYQSISISVHQK